RPVDGGARPGDAAVARRGPDPDADARRRGLVDGRRARGLPGRAGPGRLVLGGPPAHEEDGLLMAMLTTSVGRAAASPISAGEATGLLLYRNYLAYRRAWYLFVSGFLEPVFYLFSIGGGVGRLWTAFESTR